MVKILTARQFVDAAIRITKIPTRYGWGTFGQLITEQLIQDKAAQYPDYWGAAHRARFRALIGKAYSFDCVGLVKGILWGWTEYGVPYRGSIVPDVSADGMIRICEGASDDFSDIPIGAFVWLPAHCGVYIGNGQVVEATPAWEDGVQITRLSQREWVKWGLLPWVDYREEKKAEQTVSKWAADAQRWVIESGISDGTRPKDAVTREQVWTMLYRMNNTGA